MLRIGRALRRPVFVQREQAGSQKDTENARGGAQIHRLVIDERSDHHARQRFKGGKQRRALRAGIFCAELVQKACKADDNAENPRDTPGKRRIRKGKLSEAKRRSKGNDAGKHACPAGKLVSVHFKKAAAGKIDRIKRIGCSGGEGDQDPHQTDGTPGRIKADHADGAENAADHLAKRQLLVPKQHAACKHKRGIHEVNGRRKPGGQIVIRGQQQNRRRGKADGTDRKIPAFPAGNAQAGTPQTAEQPKENRPKNKAAKRQRNGIPAAGINSSRHQRIAAERNG